MNGIHDMGGMHGMGSIEREKDEPVFHEEWEKRIFAILCSTLADGHFSLNEVRRTVETMTPAGYLQASYYERWVYNLEKLSTAKGMVTADELEARIAELRQKV